MSTKGVDLEILLGWNLSSRGFAATLLYNAPGDLDDHRYFRPELITFDLSELARRRDEGVDEYGLALGKMLFPPDSQSLLDRAVEASGNLPVHLRLVIDPQAPPEYHAVRWETLRHPATGARLTTNPHIRFSRFIPNIAGGQPAQLARIGALRGLIAVANPRDLDGYVAGPVPLSAIAVGAEVDRARAALTGIDVDVLGLDGGPRATRANIIEALSKDIQVLYLVCHGRITADGRPEVLLEDADGDVDVVDGAAFAADLGALEHVPTIAVLCSCESAGRDWAVPPAGGVDEPRMEGTAEQLVALGPALAVAGAAVVIGMQGNVTMTTAKLFLPKFFAELDEDGIPARAMARARALLISENRPDWYMPVLFSRLKRGSAWYLPRFGGNEATMFANLHTRIKSRHCIPVIGAGIAGEDGVLPSRTELAGDWVGRRQMPIAEGSQHDLASVAQYVRVEEEGGENLVRDELFFLLRDEMRRLHQDACPDLDWDRAPLATLVSLVGARRRTAAGGMDGYSRLSHLDLPIFVTTSWTNLLEDALTAAGKDPVTRYFDWRKSTSSTEWPYLRLGDTGDGSARHEYDDPTGLGDETHRQKVLRLGREVDLEIDGTAFTSKRPLVFHLCGTVQSQRTVVITEDDYFTWLREWMKQVDNGAAIPDYVKVSLVENSQMFLGYRFDDWEFRLVFQAIKSFQNKYDDGSPHVGVQLQPDTLHVEREAAQSYLQSYFGADNITVYWQSSSAFLRELDETRSS